MSNLRPTILAIDDTPENLLTLQLTARTRS